jgi:hypothetical protein
MAINTGLGTSSANQGSLGSFGQTIQAGLTKVSGNVIGITTIKDGPQPEAGVSRAAQTRFTTENLAYPLDVEEDPRQGHYIFFNINVQNKAKVAKQAFESAVKAHEQKIQAEFEGHKAKFAFGFRGDDLKERSFEEIKKEYIKKHIIVDYDGTNESIGGSTPNPSRKDSSSLRLQNPTTSQIKTAIALYMPPSVQVSYTANYNDTEIGVMAGMGAGLIQAWKQGNSVEEMIGDVLDEAGVGVKKLALGAIEVFAPGSKAMAQILTGRAITPKMELMFNGIGRREFSYEFTFIPKSRREADVVKRIVYQFKYHMASDFIKDTGNREMEIPSTFDIQYQYSGKENKSLNRISTCVLESVDVAYGGDRFQAYPDGVPQQTKLNLKFKEMEIITKSRIAEEY